MEQIVDKLKRDQVAWISRTLLQMKRPCLRACIANYRTQQEDIDTLIEGLNSILVHADTANNMGIPPKTPEILTSKYSQDC